MRRFFLIIPLCMFITCSREIVREQQKIPAQPSEVHEGKAKVGTYPEPYTQFENNQFSVSDIIDLLEEEESANLIDKILSFRRDYDIPLVLNEKVKFFVKYFVNEQREIFKKWLERSGRYIDLMKRVLRENNLPQDLVYMALIESGFNPHAYSRARAMGPWQFIKGTARKYGLRVDFWVDERKDPIKSTLAAAKYLKDLYDTFGSWYLAAAGYNAGENKIINAMRRHGTKEFWELAETRYLKRETKDYVPKMIAAAIIAKNPELFGFNDLNYAEPFTFDVVVVPSPIDLVVVSEKCDISYFEIKELNPELLRWFTPPDVETYELRVPVGKGSECKEKLEGLQARKDLIFKKYEVKKGDTLSTIAYMFNSSVKEIMRLNGINDVRKLRPGSVIYVPARPWEKPREVIYETKRRTLYKDVEVEGQRILYTVKIGDTLWDIARRYGVSVRDIKRWNNIPKDSRIRPGDVIAIYVLGGSKKGSYIVYVVRKGDTLWTIARKFKVSLEEIKRINNLSEAPLYPGMKIKIPVEEDS